MGKNSLFFHWKTTWDSYALLKHAIYLIINFFLNKIIIIWRNISNQFFIHGNIKTFLYSLLPQEGNDYVKNTSCIVDQKFKMNFIDKINLSFPSINDQKTSHNCHNYNKIVECLLTIKYLNSASALWDFWCMLTKIELTILESNDC